jgi:hypothetical protein
MDRNKPAMARMQLNFIDYLVLPLFQTVKNILPQLETVCSRLEENRVKWSTLLKDM